MEPQYYEFASFFETLISKRQQTLALFLENKRKFRLAGEWRMIGVGISLH